MKQKLTNENDRVNIIMLESKTQTDSLTESIKTKDNSIKILNQKCTILENQNEELIRQRDQLTKDESKINHDIQESVTRLDKERLVLIQKKLSNGSRKN